MILPENEPMACCDMPNAFHLMNARQIFHHNEKSASQKRTTSFRENVEQPEDSYHPITGFGVNIVCLGKRALFKISASSLLPSDAVTSSRNPVQPVIEFCRSLHLIPMSDYPRKIQRLPRPQVVKQGNRLLHMDLLREHTDQTLRMCGVRTDLSEFLVLGKWTAVVGRRLVLNSFHPTLRESYYESRVFSMGKLRSLRHSKVFSKKKIRGCPVCCEDVPLTIDRLERFLGRKIPNFIAAR